MKKITLLLFTVLFTTLSSAQYFVDFENETSGGYASEIIELSGLEWDFQDALIGSLDNDWKNGERSARLRGYGTTNFTMVEDKPNGIGDVTFFYRRYGSDAQVEYVVEISSDGGTTWSAIAAPFTAPDTDEVQFFSATVDEANNARIRIRTTDESGSSNSRLNVDDITITDFGSVGSPSVIITSPSDNAVLDPGTTSVDISFSAQNEPAGAQFDITVNGSTTTGVTSPFNLTTQNGESYTVEVELVDGQSIAASASIDFSVADVTQVADIAALRADVDANGDGGFYEITGPVTFSHGDNFRNRKWFQNETGPGLMIFDFDGIIDNDVYAFGDQVSGLTGQSNFNNGVLQLLPTADNGVVTGNNEPSVQILSLSEFINNYESYESILVGFQNVSFPNADGTLTFENGQNYDLSDGTNTITSRTEFFNVDYIGTVIPQGELAGVVGVASEFNGNPQIFSRFAADIDVTLSIANFDKSEFAIFPNPASGKVNFKSPIGETFQVGIYNVLGRKLMDAEISGDTSLDISNLQSGIYMVQFGEGKGSFTKKLIVQ